MAVGEDFARFIDPFRPELLAHCHRMLGSVHEADSACNERLPVVGVGPVALWWWNPPLI
jgi:hypothetical protein